MCTNQREITNKYTGRKLYVKCGHCPACQQEKAAHRVSRIKFQDSLLYDCIMVTLTYRRYDCPYLYRDEAYWFSHGLLGYSDIKTKTFHPYNLNVYRDNNYRKVRVSSDYSVAYKNIGREVLCDIEPNLTDDGKLITYDFSNNKDLKHNHNKIGVCYYPDVQKFIARLRINLSRNYGFKDSFKAFCCSEYGTKTLRPHFHLLLWIPKGTFETFRSAINSSWPYGDISNFDRAVEKCYRGASYVASYVNCSSSFPVFLKEYFKPKHSYSKDFGCGSNLFSASNFMHKFESGHLTYFKQIDKQGFPAVVECPLPEYIVSRYFPRFKGYSRIAPSSLPLCMQRFGKFDYGQRSDLDFSSPQVLGINRLSFPVCYSNDEVYKISVRLTNAYKRFVSLAPERYKISFEDYCDLHHRVWSLYHSDILRLHLLNPDVVVNEKYDNLEEIKCKFEFESPDNIPYMLPIGFSKDMLLVTDPNKFVSVQFNTRRFEDSFHENIKHRSVNNVIYSSVCEEF